ncbi:MAG TPA: hypothetical protein ENK96_09125 [Desulfobulbaceae bacterium]|nr:hypothetical protein [Desulfobulbaceae bacterium]
MHPSTILRQEISCNKFYPPRVDPGTSLFRSSLITETLGNAACSQKAMIIEAQAGQGKSTIAVQFLHHFDLRFAWYQIGPEDADPALLLSALLDNLQKKLPGFESPQLSYIMDRGDMGSLDITRCANILLADLDRHLAGDFYIVFDDLHLGEQAPLLTTLLSHIIDTSPPHLHFILISRRPLALTAKKIRYETNIRLLRNRDLSFSLQEIEHLFGQVLNRQITRRDAELIRKQTSGWIMGILLAAHAATRRNPTALPANISTGLPADLSADHILKYFRHEILSHVPEDLHSILMQLSLLDEIPVDLALTITEQEDIAAILIDLMLDNFFIYPLDEQQTIFRFHHLFQEFLQERAQKHLSQKKIRHIYKTAAAYYLKINALEQALLYYRKEENFQVMEIILRREGLNLMAKNRTITLLTLLKSIPEDELRNYAWLTLFTAILYSDSYPKKSYPLLERARNHFIGSGDATGELLALVHLIYYHFVISGLYHTGAHLLPRTEELFLQNQDNLSLQAQILVARNLGAGYSFFLFQLKKARKYAQIARDLAFQNDIRNGIASSRFMCGYIETLSDNRQKCLLEIELSLSLLHDPLVSVSNKLTLRVLHLNTLSKEGDFINYNNQLQLLRTHADNHIVEQTVAAPFAYIWGAVGLIGEGRPEEAEQLLQRGMKVSETALTPHMQSQFLQWAGYVQALLGNRKAAVPTVCEAIELRQVAGGSFYTTLCNIVCGATLIRAREHARAEELLSYALAQAKELPSDYLTTVALLQRAWLHLQLHATEKMLRDLQDGLTLMENNGFGSFWSWEPVSMRKLLAEAVHAGIRPELVKQLAREKLNIFFNDNGDPLPLLEIKVLGTFGLKVEGRTILTAEELTPAQRELIALLLSEKNQKISQEKIQVALWPDSAPDKSRAKLDTLLMRLRKVLASVLPCPVKNYLKMHKGILLLDNCRIDAVEFFLLAGEGLHHARTENIWQAGNSFYKALRLWDAASPTGGNFSIGEYAKFYDRQLDMLATIGLKYGVILAESDCIDEAVNVLNKVLQIYKMDDRLITLLYTLYLRSGNMLKAKELMQQYRQTLRDQQYDQDEIDEMLFRVATSTTL